MTTECRWLGRAERLGADRWRIWSIEVQGEPPQPTGQRILIQEIRTLDNVYVPKPIGRGFEVTTAIVILADTPTDDGYPIEAGEQYHWAKGQRVSKAEWERQWLASAR